MSTTTVPPLREAGNTYHHTAPAGPWTHKPVPQGPSSEHYRAAPALDHLDQGVRMHYIFKSGRPGINNFHPFSGSLVRRQARVGEWKEAELLSVTGWGQTAGTGWQVPHEQNLQSMMALKRLALDRALAGTLTTKHWPGFMIMLTNVKWCIIPILWKSQEYSWKLTIFGKDDKIQMAVQFEWSTGSGLVSSAF